MLVIFTGPHAYISPRWYEDKERVPTWNYTAVHAYGVPQMLDDPKAKHASQRRLVAVDGPAVAAAVRRAEPEVRER